MANLLDATFARFVRTGDPEALAFVFERTAPGLLRRARTLLGDARAAEDVVQDLFLTLLAGGDHYDPARACRPYLVGALHRRAMRWRARAARQPVGPLPSEARSGDRAPEDLLHAREFAAAVARAVDALLPSSREVVRRYVELHETPQEIGRALGRPAGTVRVQLHRGLRSLRDRLPTGFFAVGLALLLRPANAQPAAPVAARSVAKHWLLAGALVVGAAGALPVMMPAPAAHASPAGVVAGRAPAPSALPTEAPGEPTRTVVADGAPAARARLRLQFADGAWAPGIGVLVCRPGSDPDFAGRRAVSDAAGVVELADLPPGAQGISTDRGTSTVLDLRAGQNQETVIALPAGTLVAGRVVDAAGAPVAGAGIWVCHAPEKPWDGQVVVHSGADGGFVLRDVPPRTTFAAVVEGRVPSPLQTAGPIARQEVVLRLGDEGASVAGIVRGPDGGAVPGAVVRIARHARSRFGLPGGDHFAELLPAREVRTDAGGQFACDGLPEGRLEISVRAATCAAALQPVRLHDGQRRTLEIRLRPGRGVHGTVRDAAGQPVAGASVTAHGHAWHQWSGVDTGADGSFRLAGVALDRLVLEVTAPDFAAHERPLSAEAAEPIDVVLQAEPRLRGRFEDAAGAPAGALWELGWRDHDPERGTGSPEAVALAADGSFTAPAGAASASARWFCRRAGEAVWQPCEVAAPAPGLVLRAGAASLPCAVRVRLVGFTRAQLADAAVLLLHEDEVYRARRPAGSTAAEVDVEVPAGRWEVMVLGQRGVCPPAREAVVAAAADTQVVDLVAPSAGTLRYLLAANGTDLEGCSAFVLDERGWQLPLRHRSATIALAAGRYTLWASSLSCMTVRGLPFEIRAGEETRLDVEARGGAVRHVGFVLPAGVAVADATLTMRCRGDLVLGGEPGLGGPGFGAGADGLCTAAIVLADDDYELELNAAGRRWRGAFTVAGEDGIVEPLVVALEPAASQSRRP